MRGPKWTEEEKQVLRDTYATRSTKSIAAQLGRPLAAIAQRAHLLGLRKPDGTRTYERAERFTPNYIAKPIDTSDLPRWKATPQYVPPRHPRQAQMDAYAALPRLYR